MRHEQKRKKRSKRWKRSAFVLIVVTAAVSVAWLLAPAARDSDPVPPGSQVVDIDGTMGGFSMQEIRARVGRPLTVRLTSVDTQFHTDGGGKHQFAIDGLGVNIIAPPKGTRWATFTPATPGVYEYYCDVCCGGRANPTMQGRLIVEA